MTQLIEIRDLSKVYERGRQKVEVLHHIDLDVEQGDFLALMGPSGSGKTTLANVIRRRTHHHFTPMSAVLSGVKELREVLAEAEMRRKREQRRTILFIDEIHRYNKAQQDACLLYTSPSPRD